MAHFHSTSWLANPVQRPGVGRPRQASISAASATLQFAIDNAGIGAAASISKSKQFTPELLQHWSEPANAEHAAARGSAARWRLLSEPAHAERTQLRRIPRRSLRQRFPWRGACRRFSRRQSRRRIAWRTARRVAWRIFWRPRRPSLRDFSLVSPLTSLTVRRLRKEPPVLLKNPGGDGRNGFSVAATSPRRMPRTKFPI